MNQLYTKVDYDSQNEHIKFQNLGSVRGGVSPAVGRDPLSFEAFKIKRLLTNHILTAQHDTDFARLLPHLEPATLETGAELYKAGDAAHYIYFPEDAVVSQMHVLADGRTTEFALTGKEGAVGLCSLFDGAKPQTHWAQTIIGGHALRIKTDTLRQEFNHCVRLQSSLFQFLNSFNEQISRRVVCNSYHLAGERFCSWLLMLADRNQDGQLLLTQEQIANHLGVQRPSVTHIAKAFRENGAIGYVRGRVTVLNRQQLENAACECYSATKLFAAAVAA